MRHLYPYESSDIGDLKVDVGRALYLLDTRTYKFIDKTTGSRIIFLDDTAYHEFPPEFARGCDVLDLETSSAPNTDLAFHQRVLHTTS
ncbi:MAG: hypothetical protein VX910_01360 [Candidatus Latescibacterota bacterium]|nr:hypothetical protein [Candidatus Latescibacterota bacterium]